MGAKVTPSAANDNFFNRGAASVAEPLISVEGPKTVVTPVVALGFKLSGLLQVVGNAVMAVRLAVNFRAFWYYWGLAVDTTKKEESNCSPLS